MKKAKHLKPKPRNEKQTLKTQIVKLTTKNWKHKSETKNQNLNLNNKH